MTNLQEVSKQDLLISLSSLVTETELVQDIQEKLGRIGFINLATVSLGNLDPETSEALAMFQEVARRSVVDAIDRSFAQKLIDITKNTDWPIALDQDGMVGLTKAAVNEVRNRKLADEDIEKIISNMEPQITSDPPIGKETSKAIALPHGIITKDWESLEFHSKTEPNQQISQALQEPERREFSSSEFLAWARH
jgi:hypothetical protein